MRTINIRLDLRLLAAILALIIVGMLSVWQPWNKQTDPKKSLTVTGQATVEHIPDEYVFSPSFSATGASSTEAVGKVSEVGNKIIAGLKELGIKDDQLTTRVDSTDSGSSNGAEIQPSNPAQGPHNGDFTAYYYITCRVKDKALAQRVTDYLATSGATGGITPRADFSLETREQLDAQVRQKAIQDARRKAETEAQELGVKLGDVISLSEDQERGGPQALGSKAEASTNNLGNVPILSGRERIFLSLVISYEIR